MPLKVTLASVTLNAFWTSATVPRARHEEVVFVLRDDGQVAGLEEFFDRVEVTGMRRQQLAHGVAGQPLMIGGRISVIELATVASRALRFSGSSQSVTSITEDGSTLAPFWALALPDETAGVVGDDVACRYGGRCLCDACDEK